MSESHIIFDFDRTVGTLVVDWSEWRRQVSFAIHELSPGSDVHPEDVKHARQNELIEAYGAEFRERLNAINAQYEKEFVTDFTPNRQVVDFIKTSAKTLFLWSSNSLSTVEEYLVALGVRNRFLRMVTREDTYFLKPNPEGFALILDHHIPLRKYVLVGDSSEDEDAAKTIGIRFIPVEEFSGLAPY